MRLEIEDERGLLSSEDVALMQRCADAAQRTEGVTAPVSVFVEIVGDAQIREINREQRGLDRATDVLSFPTVNYPVGKTAGCCAALLRREYDPETDACALGDIVISMDHVRAQAEEYGHSVRREAGYLLTHGLFHLMGYDHMTDADKPVMRGMEEKSLASIGLTREKEEETAP
ncbi:MAG: rRNA maturation RNase YbeY [Candidatus Ventricola sp.]|nr:rRNA maturation RNase YbeY [Candidatus Ventricola sp.]